MSALERIADAMERIATALEARSNTESAVTRGLSFERDCDLCGTPFTSHTSVAKYCSERCRNTATKRAYRARQAAQS